MQRCWFVLERGLREEGKTGGKGKKEEEVLEEKAGRISKERG